MSKKLIIFGAIVAAIALIMSGFSAKTYANVFASDVKVVNPGGAPFDGNLNDDTPGVGIMFRLNENATSVVIAVSDANGAVVATIDAGPQAQGLNLVVWAGVDDSGNPVPAGDYTFTVTANDTKGHSAYDLIYAHSGTKIFTRGGTTIRNPAAPNFGHPIGGNGGGGGLKRGPLNFFADGTGFLRVEPNLSRYSPFDVRDFGGTGRLYMLTSDDDGLLYYSDRLDPLSKIYRFAPSLDPATLKVIATSDDSTKKGLGIDVVGTGANKTIYWGLDSTVVRFTIGEADTFDAANFEVVAVFEPDTTGGDTADVFIRDIVIDDCGFMYLSVHKGNEPAGSNGIAVEKYDISGTLPVKRADRLWTIPVGQDNGNGRPVGFGLYRGTDLTSNADDVIYFSNGSTAVDGKWNTIRKIDDLATGGSTVVFEDISGSGTTSSNA
ncbi:MAG: flagellar hook assembly protein FlgD, partial [bacterium]